MALEVLIVIIIVIVVALLIIVMGTIIMVAAHLVLVVLLAAGVAGTVPHTPVTGPLPTPMAAATMVWVRVVVVGGIIPTLLLSCSMS